MAASLVIVGLGNPGKEYDGTRHNVGFWLLDVLAKRWGASPWKLKQKQHAELCSANLDGKTVVLAKPQTFMNVSGDSVQSLQQWEHVQSQQILVICDDIDLPLGTLRLRTKGGSGTHNGLRSIVGTVGEEFLRLRIGVGSAKYGMDLSAWVLGHFTKEEKLILQQVADRAFDMLIQTVERGAKDETVTTQPSAAAQESGDDH